MRVSLKDLICAGGCTLLLAAAFILAGCSQSDNTTAINPDIPPVAQGDPYIVYQRSGGLGELDDELRVYDGGDCRMVGKNGIVHECHMPPLKLRQIELAFEQAGFFALPDEYPGNSQASAIKYCVDYSARGKMHRVTVYSNAMPDPLLPLIRELDQCVMLVSIAGAR